MNKEIKLQKRKPSFDYILNDLAFDSLMFRVVNGIASNQDKFDFEYQIKLMQNELSRLRRNIYNAIEYIEKHSNSFSVLDTISNGTLLNILRGDSDAK